MRRAAVRHGDPTTTGGVVIAESSTIHDGGKKIALSGDKATCGNCTGAYEIIGTAYRMTEMGRLVVLDGDQVACPCGENRVIVGRDPGVFFESDEGRTDLVVANLGTSQNPSPAYDEQFVLCDGNDNPLADTHYTVRLLSGAWRHGITDLHGRTARYSTSEAQPISISLGHLDF